jgi:hypothetical protein
MSQSKSKHNHNKNQSMIPGSIPADQLPQDPESEKVKGSGSTNQNVNQNYITQNGNPIGNNTPGGNTNSQRHGNTNKPRNNPQGNWPMSVDGNQKGPGRKGD